MPMNYVAKLQSKIGKFGLIRDRSTKQATKLASNAKDEALSVLLQLQYKQKEADSMLEKAIQRNPNVKDSEELLNEVYRQRGRE